VQPACLTLPLGAGYNRSDDCARAPHSTCHTHCTASARRGGHRLCCGVLWCAAVPCTSMPLWIDDEREGVWRAFGDHRPCERSRGLSFCVACSERARMNTPVVRPRDVLLRCAALRRNCARRSPLWRSRCGKEAVIARVHEHSSELKHRLELHYRNNECSGVCTSSIHRTKTRCTPVCIPTPMLCCKGHARTTHSK
jgi:hypothetical protein